MIKDENLVKQIKENYPEAQISKKDRAMLDYAVKLTSKPWEVQREDIETLQKFGFADSEILDINLIASYYNFVNRVADGLGVELESPKV